MKVSEVMIYFDYTMNKVAEAATVSRESVRHWKIANKIPYPYQCVIEKFTNGMLKANQED